MYCFEVLDIYLNISILCKFILHYSTIYLTAVVTSIRHIFFRFIKYDTFYRFNMSILYKVGKIALD